MNHITAMRFPADGEDFYSDAPAFVGCGEWGERPGRVILTVDVGDDSPRHVVELYPVRAILLGAGMVYRGARALFSRVRP